MDGRGGCCIARYAAAGGGGGGGGAYDRSKMDRIMLKFRPIAPKPPSSVSVSGGTSPEKSDILAGTVRPKRRYVRDRNKIIKKRQKKVVSLPETTVKTFLFLPEKPDETGVESPGLNPVQNQPIWMNGDYNKSIHPTVVMPQPVRPVGSCCIVVGCLTENGGGGEGIMGCTDEEKRCSLEKDTCPGFISDGLNRVRWTNEAYRKMVNNQDGERRSEMVWLVMEKGFIPLDYPAFTCRVRLKYRCRKEISSLTVPCDVWRLDGGGFAWRLDVKSALCLGR